MMLRSEDGYSLMELIVVMAIVAFTASVGVTMFRPQNKVQTPAQLADGFVTLFNTARLKAIQERKEVVVIFSIDRTKDLLLDGVQQFSIDDTITGLRALTGRRQMDTSTDAYFVFYPEGRATGGSIEFDDGSKLRKVDVNWLTGLVSQSLNVKAP